MEKSAVSVKIYNETYILKTDAAENDVLAVAELVNGKMHELAEKHGVQNTEKVAVWTALDCAAELYKLRRNYEKLLAVAKEL